METLSEQSIPAIIFEHACKDNHENTVHHILKNEDLISQVLSNVTSSEQSQTKPVFIFAYLLNKLHSSNVLSEINGEPEKLNGVLPLIIDLLETTFHQFHFISLKKYFMLISELKLLDLLSLIVKSVESTDILQKLNQYFPRWTLNYRTELEKNFCIENSKILDKVEESHAKFRRLVLKLAVDLAYRSKYMSDQYANDVKRIIKESKEYLKETVEMLQSCAKFSLLEKMTEDEESCCNAKNLSMQLLFEYIQPEITDDALVKFLEDIEPTLNSQPAAGLASCLSPLDSMSEDESDLSESDYECSQSNSQPMSQENSN